MASFHPLSHEGFWTFSQHSWSPPPRPPNNSIRPGLREPLSEATFFHVKLPHCQCADQHVPQPDKCLWLIFFRFICRCKHWRVLSHRYNEDTGCLKIAGSLLSHMSEHLSASLPDSPPRLLQSSAMVISIVIILNTCSRCIHIHIQMCVLYV